jgi:glyceraldehyde 3-phosphate dehydrogenase
MIRIGINGFGRIGKCVFLQLLENKNFEIVALNISNFNIDQFEEYIKYDSTHRFNNKFNINIINDKLIKINHHNINILSDRDPKNLNWKDFNCKIIIDATGAFLTTEKCLNHNVDYIIMSAPPKDDTQTFIYGVNEDKYNGENIISGSSCTTNGLAPILKLINDNYSIKDINFTTIHAATASQYTIDVLKKSSRTNRSILNNIIPHSTGATKSINDVLPELSGKINGTSVRVPVSNCSLIDINIILEEENVTLDDIEKLLINHKNFGIVYEINKLNLVSSDFITTTTPCIFDKRASMDMKKGKLKLMVWYDNEWSYSTQLIRLAEHIYNFNKSIKDKYYIENYNFNNKNVFLRLDYNVPVNNGSIMDDFRISSTIPTINKILNDNPKNLILCAHFGRPKGIDKKLSIEFIIPVLKKYLNREIFFLEEGISENTINIINNTNNIFLLENIRFHDEETNYNKIEDLNNNKIIKMFRELADIYVLDSFGCLHRKHMSLYDIKNSKKEIAYGYLINKELNNIDMLFNNSNKKILGIIGGNKIKDKLPLIDTLKNIDNSKIFIGGGLAKHFKSNNSNQNNLYLTKDGYGNKNLEDKPEYIGNLDDEKNLFDIGDETIIELKKLINEADIIFWNGALGVIEHDYYKLGSNIIAEYLLDDTQKNKKIIIGGGETSTLFPKDSHIYISTGGGALLEYLENKILYKKNIVGLSIFE